MCCRFGGVVSCRAFCVRDGTRTWHIIGNHGLGHAQSMSVCLHSNQPAIITCQLRRSGWMATVANNAFFLLAIVLFFFLAGVAVVHDALLFRVRHCHLYHRDDHLPEFAPVPIRTQKLSPGEHG